MHSWYSFSQRWQRDSGWRGHPGWYISSLGIIAVVSGGGGGATSAGAT